MARIKHALMETSSLGPGFLNRTVVHLVLICAAGLIIYSNTFNVPFQCDEDSLIKNNPIVKDLSYFVEPSRATGLEQYSALKTRYIGFLTFALNYAIHGLDVMGYHIVNLSIHVLNAFLLYFFVILTFNTPFLGESHLKAHSRVIALFSALFFISHPIQTEAVTYIFQRLASLVTFFYLFSLTTYVKSRLSERRTGRYSFYALSIISAVMAMKTKENAFTLPIVIALYDSFFFKDSLKRRIFRLAPLLLTMGIIPLAHMAHDIPMDGIGAVIRHVDSAASGLSRISRSSYLFTEFRVIVTYLRLLLFPVNQNFYYEYPWFHSFFDKRVFLSFLLLSAIICSGIYLLYRSRIKPELRLISFGIFGFFIALSVESSVIPLPLFINEYRVYLPSTVLFPAAVCGMYLLSEKVKSKKAHLLVISVLIIMSVSFSFGTYARNEVWQSGISLWEDTVRKSPGDVNAHNNLGRSYDEKGMYDKAIQQYLIAAKLDPRDAHTFYDLGIDYMAIGMIAQAVELYKVAVSLQPHFPEAHNNLGNAFAAKGMLDAAMEQYHIALSQSPAFPDAHYNLGQVYIMKGDINGARREFEAVLRIELNHYRARQSLNSISK